VTHNHPGVRETIGTDPPEEEPLGELRRALDDTTVALAIRLVDNTKVTDS